MRFEGVRLQIAATARHREVGLDAELAILFQLFLCRWSDRFEHPTDLQGYVGVIGGRRTTARVVSKGTEL